MSKSEVETISGRGDGFLVGAALLIALAGVVGFTLAGDRPLVLRLAMLFGGLAVGFGVAWFSGPGKRFAAFSQDSYDEVRKVTWPTRDETLKTTGAVFAFVVAMALFLFAVDKIVEWGLYDLILGWKR